MDEKQSEIQRARQHRKIGIENYNRGIECQQRSDNNKAYEYFQMSINEFNDMLNILLRGTNKTAVSVAHNCIGCIYAAVSRFQQAADHYNLALEADPNNVVAKNNLQQAQLYYAQQVQQAACDELQERFEQSNAIEEIMRLPGGPLAPWQPRPPF
jgi:tetratricopeptide (TPR) repeat protein